MGQPTELEDLLVELRIPDQLVRGRDGTDSARTQTLTTWKSHAIQSLSSLLALFGSKQKLDALSQAEIIMTILPLISKRAFLRWDSEELVRISVELWEIGHERLPSEILSLDVVSKPSEDIVTHILAEKLRPIFRANPHPRLHTSTARTLPRPAGGPMSMQDFYDDQQWKQHTGISNVVLWCIQVTESDSFENRWHLLIPPIMAFLDDYEVNSKLQGVVLVRSMLERISKGLLKRTGIDVLLQQSLHNALGQLDHLESPSLVYLTIRTSIDLILLTTTPGSKERFDQLSSLMGEGIISGIWIFSGDKPDIVGATLDALPHLVQALGLGATRFFQAIIPQLSFVLIPKPFVHSNVQLQLSALKVFETLLNVGAPRVSSWIETILDAVGRCWVGIRDGTSCVESSNEEVNELEYSLRNLCAKLAKIRPSVLQQEYPAFLAADEYMFQSLFSLVSWPAPEASQNPYSSE